MGTLQNTGEGGEHHPEFAHAMAYMLARFVVTLLSTVPVANPWFGLRWVVSRIADARRH
jgi:hypothetical protein